MSKIKKWFSDSYNSCGHVFLFVVLVNTLGKLTGSSESVSALDGSIIMDFLLALVNLLAIIGALNIADRINSNLKAK